jgi:hypothetical protein
MAKKTQGTDLYAIDPADDSLLVVGCVTSIDGIDTALDQIETTCLSDTTRTYESGLATPGAATFGINTDPSDPSHVRLHQLKVAGTVLKWAIGWSDSTVPPTIDSAGDFELPDSRSWLTFNGYMSGFPFSFAQNTVVQSNVAIQISGEPVLIGALEANFITVNGEPVTVGGQPVFI